MGYWSGDIDFVTRREQRKDMLAIGESFEVWSVHIGESRT